MTENPGDRVALVKVDIARRKYEAESKSERARGDYGCACCGRRHDNYNAHVEHELCEKCRADAFDKARKEKACCRCGTKLEPLTPFGSRPESRGQFLACLACGLVITRG